MFRVLGLVLLVSSAWSWVPHPHRATVRPSAVTPLPGIRSSSAKLLGRLRPKRKVEDQAPLIIAVGARLPETDVQVQVADDNKEAGAGDQTFLEAVGTGSRAIVLGMPGAFTPTCTQEHLPGYVTSMPAFRKLGIDKVVVVTTNDQYVNAAWTAQFDTGSKDKITFVSDGDGELVRALGLAEDMGFGVGIRSKRFALVVDKGVVTNILTDEGLDSCEATSATSVLSLIKSQQVDAADGSDDGEGSVLIMGIGLLAAAAAALSFMGGGDISAPSASTPTRTSVEKTVKKQAPRNSKSASPMSLLDTYKDN